MTLNILYNEKCQFLKKKLKDGQNNSRGILKKTLRRPRVSISNHKMAQKKPEFISTYLKMIFQRRGASR